MSIDQDALDVVDSFMVDIFDREAHVAAVMSRYAHRKTMMVKDVVGATEIYLQQCPALLSHALKRGKTAVQQYNKNKKKNIPKTKHT